jgi:predicted DNA-binding transcriptional regulator YafY
MRRLHLDVRGFYRDLELLRDSGITINLEARRYRLLDKTANAITRLPFPDPHPTLGEALQLARGRTRAHRKLKKQVAEILP